MVDRRRHILEEIRRLSKANGVAPGKRLFERETGVRESDWFPHLWLRWSEAIREAGLAPNTMTQPGDTEMYLRQFALLARRLGRPPLIGEMIRESKTNTAFPSEKAFRNRFGNKSGLIENLIGYCEKNSEFHDVLALCGDSRPRQRAEDIPNPPEEGQIGYVYLIQHGNRREFKIGRTNNRLRREGEIGVELPLPIEPIHVIATDDPAGIESYWHRRFSAKRLKNEWFALSAADVAAFKKWRRIT